MAEETSECSNCGKSIEQSKMRLHEAYCSAHLYKCRCGKLVERKRQVEHDEEHHPTLRCKHCKQLCAKSTIVQHQSACQVGRPCAGRTFQQPPPIPAAVEVVDLTHIEETEKKLDDMARRWQTISRATETAQVVAEAGREVAAFRSWRGPWDKSQSAGNRRRCPFGSPSAASDFNPRKTRPPNDCDLECPIEAERPPFGEYPTSKRRKEWLDECSEEDERRELDFEDRGPTQGQRWKKPYHKYFPRSEGGKQIEKRLPPTRVPKYTFDLSKPKSYLKPSSSPPCLTSKDVPRATDIPKAIMATTFQNGLHSGQPKNNGETGPAITTRMQLQSECKTSPLNAVATPEVIDVDSECRDEPQPKANIDSPPQRKLMSMPFDLDAIEEETANPDPLAKLHTAASITVPLTPSINNNPVTHV